MNDLKKISNSKKQTASFLKIYIQNDDFKLNIIPIPLFFAKAAISFIMRLYRFSLNFHKDSTLSKYDVNDILKSIKQIVKELKNHPPFDIVEIDSKDTKISIRTK